MEGNTLVTPDGETRPTVSHTSSQRPSIWMLIQIMYIFALPQAPSRYLLFRFSAWTVTKRRRCVICSVSCDTWDDKFGLQTHGWRKANVQTWPHWANSSDTHTHTHALWQLHLISAFKWLLIKSGNEVTLMVHGLPSAQLFVGVEVNPSSCVRLFSRAAINPLSLTPGLRVKQASRSGAVGLRGPFLAGRREERGQLRMSSKVYIPEEVTVSRKETRHVTPVNVS